MPCQEVVEVTTACLTVSFLWKRIRHLFSGTHYLEERLSCQLDDELVKTAGLSSRVLN